MGGGEQESISLADTGISIAGKTDPLMLINKLAFWFTY